MQALYEKVKAFNDRAGKLESERKMESMLYVVMNEAGLLCPHT